jgi:hypothetical protein
MKRAGVAGIALRAAWESLVMIFLLHRLVIIEEKVKVFMIDESYS